MPPDTPCTVNIDVCNLCNFKCKFRAVNYSNEEVSFKKKTMDFGLFRKIIDDLTEFSEKVKMLRLSGLGEPLINKSLPEMIAYAKEKNVSEHIEIITNGSLLKPELNRRLTESGLDRIRISIEGIDAAAYEEMADVRINRDEFTDNIRDL